VRIHPIHLVDRSVQGHGLVRIELGGKGMMRQGRTMERKQRSEGYQ
jgi:hypothetical protein